MTPSINRLAEVALAVGPNIMAQEWDLIVDDFGAFGPDDFDGFKTWIQDFHYYEGVVLAMGGNLDKIIAQLEADYDELTAVAGMEAG
jgi:hypothetical protein